MNADVFAVWQREVTTGNMSVFKGLTTSSQPTKIFYDKTDFLSWPKLTASESGNSWVEENR